MRTWGLGPLLGATAAGSTGCDPGPTSPATRKPGERVDLVEADFATLDKAVAEQKGLVVLVDIWATWCGPCRERFPHLVALHTKYADLGLVCMTLSLDNRDDKDSALRFLNKQGATFPNFLFAPRDAQDGRAFADRYRFTGAIPYMAVFGRNGDQVFAGNGGQISRSQLDRLINEELDKNVKTGRAVSGPDTRTGRIDQSSK